MSGLISLYTPPPPSRPRPIAESAHGWVRWLGFIGSVVLAAVGYGVLTLTQGDALTGLFGTIPGIVNAIATALTAFGIVRQAEPQVTPLISPRDIHGRQLRAPVEGMSGPVDPRTEPSWWETETDSPFGAQRGRARTPRLSVAEPLEDADPDDADSDDVDPGVDPTVGDRRGWTATMVEQDQVETRHGGSDTPIATYPAESAAPTPADYRAPETYPVADSPSHGHHGSSDGGSSPSGGGQ